MDFRVLDMKASDQREPRQYVRNLKDLYGSYLKQNIGKNVDIFLQNKRNLTSTVVFCRPHSYKWRILAILKVWRSPGCPVV